MYQKLLYALIALLLLPALFFNLGEMTFIDDEAIRALVAQEMIWSGDYLVPTLHGDVYLNKPPLWNWIQVLSIEFWGRSDEWVTRFPTVVALLGFAITTFIFSRPVLGKKLAFIHAFTVITCGRMLFWDSMLGLIDVTFSWVVYTQFMLLWHFWRKEQLWRAFGFVYLLCAVGFMLKGLPAIAFTGITVIALLVWQRRFWALFSSAHLVSGLGCLGLLALYYVPLGQELDLAIIGKRLFVESGKRTAVNHPWQETLGHLLAFPFEMIYHFLPWTLLIVFFFRRNFMAQLESKPTVQFWLLAFLVNLPLYWLSPNVYPRYLLMLFPLLFGAGLHFYRQSEGSSINIYRWFHAFISGLMLLFTVAFFLAPLHPDTTIVAYRWPLAVGCGFLGLLIIWLGAKIKNPFGYQSSKAGVWRQPLLAFVAFLLLFRLVFNLFILPPRAAGDERGQRLRKDAIKIGNQFRESDEELAVLGYTLMEPATSYYLEMTYGGIVPRIFESPEKTMVYIYNPWQYREAEKAGKWLDGIYMRHQKIVYPVRRIVPPIPSTEYTKTVLKDGMGSGVKRKK